MLNSTRWMVSTVVFFISTILCAIRFETIFGTPGESTLLYSFIIAGIMSFLIAALMFILLGMEVRLAKKIKRERDEYNRLKAYNEQYKANLTKLRQSGN